MRIRSTIAALGLAAAATFAFGQSNLPDGLYAKISTDKGVITLRLDYDKAPLTVTNFVGLAEGTLDANKGKRFYDGLTFHRVVADFVIQGGDPKGDGSGGPGYQFPNEISPELRHDAAGVLAMANAGPDTNGSQFYITLAPTPFLDGNYSVFGRVVDGLEVVRAIAKGDVMRRVEIVRVGAAAKAFKADQKSFDERKAALLASKAKAAAAKKETDIAAIKKMWPDLARNGDGTFSKLLKAGSGPLPQAGQTVAVLYKGMFIDGRVFDQSSAHGGAPIEFQVGKGQVIPGWDKVLLTMKKGEKRLVIFPPDLGYGAAGAGGVIPPDAYLAFEMELVDIK